MSLLDCLFPQNPVRPQTVRLVTFETGRPRERVISYNCPTPERPSWCDEEISADPMWGGFTNLKKIDEGGPYG